MKRSAFTVFGLLVILAIILLGLGFFLGLRSGTRVEKTFKSVGKTIVVPDKVDDKDKTKDKK